MVGTDEGRGCVETWVRDLDLRDAGYGRYNRNPMYMFFPAATDLEDHREHDTLLFLLKLK
jgi:hypothetical protein